jgi:hypothetical protein
MEQIDCFANIKTFNLPLNKHLTHKRSPKIKAYSAIANNTCSFTYIQPDVNCPFKITLCVHIELRFLSVKSHLKVGRVK